MFNYDDLKDWKARCEALSQEMRAKGWTCDDLDNEIADLRDEIGDGEAAGSD